METSPSHPRNHDYNHDIDVSNSKHVSDLNPRPNICETSTFSRVSLLQGGEEYSSNDSTQVHEVEGPVVVVVSSIAIETPPPSSAEELPKEPKPPWKWVHEFSNMVPTSHPIFDLVSDQDLIRQILFQAIPLTSIMLSIHNLVEAPLEVRLLAMCLSLGVALLWNGILLQRGNPRISGLMKLLGVSMMLLAFYSLMGLFLPRAYAVIILLCFVLCLLPYATAFHGRRGAESALESGGLIEPESQP